MVKISVFKQLDCRVSSLKGVLEIADTYINSINKRIQEYLVKYGSLPLLELKYGYIEGKGITVIDIRVLDEMKESWKVSTN